MNVPATFYDSYVQPRFAAATAPVYVLPEVKTLHQVFGSYEVAPRDVKLHHSMKNQK